MEAEGDRTLTLDQLRFLIAESWQPPTRYWGCFEWFAPPVEPLPIRLREAFHSIVEGTRAIDGVFQAHLRQFLAQALADRLTVPQFLAILAALRLLECPASGQFQDALAAALPERMDRQACSMFCGVVWFLSIKNWRGASERDLVEVLPRPKASPRQTAKQALGLSFQEFRAAIIIRLAVLRLAHTREDVRQIAYGLDYSHASAFNHHFKALVGLSPSGYRKLVWGLSGEIPLVRVEPEAAPRRRWFRSG